MRRPTSQRRSLGVMILAVLGVCVALKVGPSAGERVGEAQGADSFTRTRASGVTVNLGRVPARPVDPASAGYEGKDSGAWDGLAPSERAAQTEAKVVAMLAEIDATAAEGARRARRDDAMMILSAARSDYFDNDEGGTRYLELELAIEGGQ
ncbi:hypothetical protein [Enhygromyxa salina]|nr:hypothetical protein [Enhygromyxa salina]